MTNRKQSHWVTTKANHTCYSCGHVIPAGTKCWTGSNKVRRVWLHGKHIMSLCGEPYTQCSTKKNLDRARAAQNELPFGDEGGWHAGDDYISNMICQICSKCDADMCPYNADYEES